MPSGFQKTGQTEIFNCQGSGFWDIKKRKNVSKCIYPMAAIILTAILGFKALPGSMRGMSRMLNTDSTRLQVYRLLGMDGLRELSHAATIANALAEIDPRAIETLKRRFSKPYLSSKALMPKLGRVLGKLVIIINTTHRCHYSE